MSGANIKTNLSHFLFKYRITQQTTTGLASAEMLLGQKPKSHKRIKESGSHSYVVRLSDRQEVCRHQDHVKSRQVAEQCSCVKQVSGFENKKSSEL